MSCKNFPFRLIGCTLFLFVGARTQSAKAVLPDPNVVEAHWRKNPKIFQETFEVLFSQAESLNLWSKGFPGRFKGQNRNLTVKTDSGDLSFHTLDDLGKLSCDADLKKIIKVVGSREFLENVLSEEVVKSIFAHASGKDFRTEITFQPRLEKNFFNMFGKGELRMRIEQFFNGSQVLDCNFAFVFEKKNRLTVLTNYDVSYAIAQGGKRWSTGAEFLKKTERLPDFPWDSSRNAKNRFSTVYAKLRDDLEKERKKYEDCKICSIAKDAMDDFLSFRKDFYEQDPYYVEAFPTKAQKMAKEEARRRWHLECSYHVSSLLNIIITEDFLNGIFGEKFWNIFENGDTLCGGYSSTAHFEISEYTGGLKVSFLLRNIHRGNMTEDVVHFYGDGKVNWEWLDSNYINFVFLYDPSKDKIPHVRLCDKLVLNHKIIQTGDTKNTLLPIGSEDSYRPNSFWLEVQADDIVKHFRCVTGDGKITLGSVVKDIDKTCYRFGKDVESSMEILSRWAQGKKAPRIFLKMTKSLPLLKKGDITASSEGEQESSRDAKRLEKNPLLDEPE